MVSPQKSQLVAEPSRSSRAAVSSADATRGHRVTLRKREISSEKQWQRNSAPGNTEEQQLNSLKGHAQSLYPTGKDWPFWGCILLTQPPRHLSIATAWYVWHRTDQNMQMLSLFPVSLVLMGPINRRPGN